MNKITMTGTPMMESQNMPCKKPPNNAERSGPASAWVKK